MLEAILEWLEKLSEKKEKGGFGFKKIFTILFIIFIGYIVVNSGLKQISTGERGLKTTWGEINGPILTEGLHFYTPIKDGIIVIDVKERVVTDDMLVFSKDVQQVWCCSYNFI